MYYFLNKSNSRFQHFFQCHNFFLWLQHVLLTTLVGFSYLLNAYDQRETDLLLCTKNSQHGGSGQRRYHKVNIYFPSIVLAGYNICDT